MPWISRHKKSLLYTGGGILLLAWFVLIHPRVRVPPSRTHNYLIFAGSVSRALVVDSRTATQAGKPSLPRLPHHLEFTSSNGPVEVYVLDLSHLDPRAQVSEMLNQTNELIAGHPPQKFLAKGSGDSGRIDLHWWPYGTAKYVALIHSPQQSEVVLEVHYGP